MARNFSCGWDVENNECLEQLVCACDDVENLNYELKNCVRGANTRCYNYSDLSEYVRNLADTFSQIADDLENCDEDEEECECECEWN